MLVSATLNRNCAWKRKVNMRVFQQIRLRLNQSQNYTLLNFKCKISISNKTFLLYTSKTPYKQRFVMFMLLLMPHTIKGDLQLSKYGYTALPVKIKTIKAM